MIERPHEIQFAKWMPRRDAVVSLEDDGKVYIIVSFTLFSAYLREFNVRCQGVSQSNDVTELGFERLRVHSVDITSDEKW